MNKWRGLRVGRVWAGRMRIVSVVRVQRSVGQTGLPVPYWWWFEWVKLRK